MSQSEFNFNIYKETVKRIAPLTDADCDMFIPHLKIKQYAKGTHFVAEGQISNEIGFISKVRMQILNTFCIRWE